MKVSLYSVVFDEEPSDSQDPDAIALDWVVDGNSISAPGSNPVLGEATFSDSSLIYGTYNLGGDRYRHRRFDRLRSDQLYRERFRALVSQSIQILRPHQTV